MQVVIFVQNLNDTTMNLYQILTDSYLVGQCQSNMFSHRRPIEIGGGIFLDCNLHHTILDLGS